MKLGIKIGGGFSVVILISIAMGVIGWIGISTLSYELHEMGEEILPAIQVLTIAKESFMLIGECQRTLINPETTDTEYQKTLKDQEKAEENYRAALKQYGEFSRAGEEAQIWEKFVQVLKELEKENTVFAEGLVEIKSTGIKDPEAAVSNLNLFIGDHYKVEGMLAGLIFSGKKFDGGTDHFLCNYGKWLKTLHASNNGIRAIIETTEEPHRFFHANVKAIKELMAANKKVEAEKLLLGDFRKNMDAVVMRLEAMNEKMHGLEKVVLKTRLQCTVNCEGKQEEAISLLNKIIDMHDKEALHAREAAAASSAFAKIATIIALSIGIAAGILIAFFITSLITKPVKAAAALAAAMSAGDMTQRMEIKTKDEVGEMGTALNATCAALSKIISEIQENAEALAASSEEVSAISTELAAGAEQITNQTTTIAGATEQMSANIKTVDDAAGQMSLNSQTISAASTQISQNMGTVASAAEESQTNVNAMASASEEMTATINEVAQNAQRANETTNNAVNSVNQASEQVEKLASAALEIDKIIAVIIDIAEQTKLLALNATIEAARAGEAGKGFAVVASEVKELAKQTNGATDDIKKRIMAMQGSTKLTVEKIKDVSVVIQEVNSIVTTIAAAVEEQNVTMKQNAQNVAQVAEGIQEVTKNVVHVNSGINSIAKSISESAEGAKDVARNAAEATKGAEDVSKNVSGISDAVQETSQGAQQLNTAAADLANMAANLQEMMAKFKVDASSVKKEAVVSARPAAVKPAAKKQVAAPKKQLSKEHLPSLDGL
ncbi:MAG: hypothetical protein A2020_12810 [Lentisphaerae bacterium GWF2_45_14]|nr:MAG: hypothetical protein A2020_12810 [Lentisphaerae bacterium GWF2_45_14]